MFFNAGTCRNGENCRFLHESKGKAAAIVPPMPIMVEVPNGHPVFSIDVECVATATHHNARSIAQIALVDQYLRPIFNAYIKQDLPVISYMTQLTGLTKEILDTHGLPLSEALIMLRAALPPNAILVGQNILKDVQWLQLAEGVDYHSLIDLAGLFRVWNPMRAEYTSFSQDHCAKVWIGVMNRMHHNAIEDAAISMSLFNAYTMVQYDPMRLYQLQLATITAPRTPGFSSMYPVVDGCCMGNRKKCSCGAPFF